jgi:hypothetical protein
MNIIRVIKWRRMTWVKYEASHRSDENAYKMLVAKLKREETIWENNFEVDVEYDRRVSNGLIWLSMGTSGHLL